MAFVTVNLIDLKQYSLSLKLYVSFKPFIVGVIMLDVVMINVVILNVILLNVVMLYVIKLSVI